MAGRTNCLLRHAPSSCSPIPEKPAIVSVHRISCVIIAVGAHGISQNSSAFGDVRCVSRVQTRSRIAGSRRERRRTPVSEARKRRKSVLRRATWKETPPRLVMTTTFKLIIILTYVTASALLTKCNSLRCPALPQHADANMERLWRPIRQARPTEQQPIIMIRRMARRIQPDSKEFRSAGVERSAVHVFRSRRSYHQQLRRARIDHDYLED